MEKGTREALRFNAKHKPYQGKEAGLQKQVATFLDLHKELWCHVPNEAKRSKVLGRMLKEQGLKAGVPDVLIFSKSLAVELKAGNNKPTASQIQWLQALRKAGWQAWWVASFDEFEELYKSL